MCTSSIWLYYSFWIYYKEYHSFSFVVICQ